MVSLDQTLNPKPSILFLASQNGWRAAQKSVELRAQRLQKPTLIKQYTLNFMRVSSII